MDKKLIFLVLLVTISLGSKAQKGNNALSLNGEITVPVYQNDQGPGFFIKGAYGIHHTAQLTFSAGFSRFTNRNTVEQGEITTRLVPFLLGYKKNIHRFFIEPQVGFGELGGRLKLDGDYARPSVAALFGALGAGYTFKRLMAGMRFQTAHGIEGSSAGTWHDMNFHYTSIFIGYNLLYKHIH